MLFLVLIWDLFIVCCYHAIHNASNLLNPLLISGGYVSNLDQGFREIILVWTNNYSRAVAVITHYTGSISVKSNLGFRRCTACSDKLQINKTSEVTDFMRHLPYPVRKECDKTEMMLLNTICYYPHTIMYS